jgi:hypothetical protein
LSFQLSAFSFSSLHPSRGGPGAADWEIRHANVKTESWKLKTES